MNNLYFLYNPDNGKARTKTLQSNTMLYDLKASLSRAGQQSKMGIIIFNELGNVERIEPKEAIPWEEEYQLKKEKSK